MTDAVSRLSSALEGRYRLELDARGDVPTLGRGGMATGYLARDLRHDRQVVLKVLRPELVAAIDAERFLHEIRPTAALRHPHILSLYDSGWAGGGPEGRTDDFLYYVMPYVDGETLRDRLTREKRLAIEDAVRIAGEVAGALDYAHDQGVIHRDLKPGNILLHGGRALVTEFGIALAATLAARSRMTDTGISLGAPTYMSPEQAQGELGISAQSDIYALGCITYEMLVGEPPFSGQTVEVLIAQVTTGSPRSLQAERPTVPTSLEAALRRAMEKRPEDRFQTAGEFATALTDPTYASRITAASVRPSAREWRSTRTRMILAVVTVAIIAGLGIWRSCAGPSTH